jgi:steroid delta-isomerase-like uncharacterized protein
LHVSRLHPILRRWVDSLNRGAPALEETFAADATVELVGHPEVHDRESFARALQAIAVAFPDLQFTVDELLPADEAADATVMRWTARATHRGELMGLPPTGRSVTFQGMIVDRLRDGKIVERHELYDRLALLQQLGVVPGPGQSS